MHREVNESSEDRSSCQSEIEDNQADEECKRGRRRRAHGDVSGKNFENYRKRAADDKEIQDSSQSEFSQSGTEDNDEIYPEPFLEPDAICKEHNMKIHSWHKYTRQLLCTQCVQSKNLTNQHVQIFAQAVREVKTRMLEAKELNKYRKLQLTQVMT